MQRRDRTPAPLALAVRRAGFLGPVVLDVERPGPLAQLLVLADLRLRTERRRYAVAECPLAAVAVIGAHVAADEEAPVRGTHVGSRAMYRVERPQQQIAGLHLANHRAVGIESGTAQLLVRGMSGHDRAVLRQAQVAVEMAAGNDPQGAVGGGLAVDGEPGVE